MTFVKSDKMQKRKPFNLQWWDCEIYSLIMAYTVVYRVNVNYANHGYAVRKINVNSTSLYDYNQLRINTLYLFANLNCPRRCPDEIAFPHMLTKK